MSSNLRKENKFVKIMIRKYQSVIIIALLASAFIIPSLPDASAAARLILRTTQQIYITGDPLVIYGAAEPNDVLVIRFYDPGGRAIKIDNVQVDKDGFYKEGIFEWPEPSRNLPFGTYTIEAIPSIGGKNAPQQIQVTFAEGAQEGTGIQVPISHILAVKLDSPDQVAVGQSFRVFVQITFDGVLVNARDAEETKEILGTSHIHSGKGNTTISLADSFIELHEGLYYADVKIDTEGAYIVHAVAFNKGFLSHDSKVISVSKSTTGTIQETVDQLGRNLDDTNHQLSDLEEGLHQTRSALNDTKAAITKSVDDASSSIDGEINSMEAASGQLNSLILPVLALISVIIALQISLFARIRASYR
jgi:hypothetical protein